MSRGSLSNWRVPRNRGPKPRLPTTAAAIALTSIRGASEKIAHRPRAGAATPPAQAASGGQLRLEEIARAIDYRTAVDVWQRFRTGERGVLGRHIYSPDGQATFDEVARRYDREPDFRGTVDRYIGDFERLLGEAEASDPEGRMLQNYLTSESGRVYLLLAHASGRLQ